MLVSKLVEKVMERNIDYEIAFETTQDVAVLDTGQRKRTHSKTFLSETVLKRQCLLIVLPAFPPALFIPFSLLYGKYMRM